MQSGTGAIHEVGEQFGHILSMVKDIQVQMNEINSSVQTVSKETEAIVKMVDSIDEISKNTSDHVKSISAAAGQTLAKMSEDMQDDAGKFKV